MRYTPSTQLHITLAFLGEVADDRPAAEAVEAAARRLAPFGVTLAGPATLPTFGRPRTIVLDLDGGRAQVVVAALAVREELEARRVPFDRKPPLPHVTAARVRDVADPASIRRALAPARVAEGLTFRVESVDLFQSTLGPSGARYALRARAELRGDRATE